MSSKFFCNKSCEYYPCHKMKSDLNCLFCYCPLYLIPNCGGNYTLINNKIKDCSKCLIPHIKSNYDKIIQTLIDYNNNLLDKDIV